MGYFHNDRQQRAREAYRDDEIVVLKERIAELEAINEQHRKLNGELREALRTARAEGEAEGRAAVEGREAMLIDLLKRSSKMAVPWINGSMTYPEWDALCSDIESVLSATPASIAARDAQLIQQGRDEGLRDAAEIAKSTLCVLVAARDGQTWSMNMLKDFEFAIKGCRAIAALRITDEKGEG